MRKILPILAAAFLLLSGLYEAMAAKPVRVVSPGGIEAWLIEDHANPILSVEIAWRESGAAYDPKGKEGLSRMTAGLLDEGAGPYDSQEFQRRLEDLSIKLSFQAGTDMMRAHLTTLTRNRASAFDMLRLALVMPRFDEAAVQRVKGQMLAQIARSAQDPQTMASRAWFKTAFGGHPYANGGEGTEDGIAAITAQDLKQTVKRLGRSNIIIGVTGDITPAELQGLLDDGLGQLPAQAIAPAALQEIAPAVPQPGIKPLVIRKAIPQSVVQFGLEGVKRDDPDWFPAYILNYILGGGGFTSRLMVEIREKRGLAYSAYGYLYPLDRTGIWLGGVATRNDKVGKSIELLRKELTRLAEKGVTAQELADAKTYLTGSFPLRFDSSANIAELLVSLQADRLGIDYLDKRNALVEQVTGEDVARVAKRLMKPENLIVVVVGEPKGL